MKGKCEHSPLSLSTICDAYAALKASKSIPDTIVLSPKQFALLQETLNDGPTPSMGYDFDYPEWDGSELFTCSNPDCRRTHNSDWNTHDNLWKTSNRRGASCCCLDICLVQNMNLSDFQQA